MKNYFIDILQSVFVCVCISGGGRWAEVSWGRPQQKSSKGQCCSGSSGKALLWSQCRCKQEKEDIAPGKEKLIQ